MPRWLLAIPGNEPPEASEVVGRADDSAEVRTWNYPHELTIVRDDGRIFVWNAASVAVDSGTEDSLAIAINNGGVGRYLFVPAWLLASLSDGSSAPINGIVGSPGITEKNGELHLWEGGQAAAFTALAGDGSTGILDVPILGLNNSSEFTATLTVRVVFLSAATNAIVGSVDFSVDVYVVTDGAGVATVTFQTTPSPDPSRLPATMAQATCTAAAIAGGFRISASRHPGYNSLARAFWWATEWIEL